MAFLVGHQLLVSLAQTQLLGVDLLSSLDDRRDDAAAEALSAVRTPPSTMAGTLAARFGGAQPAGVEEGIGEPTLPGGGTAVGETAHRVADRDGRDRSGRH